MNWLKNTVFKHKSLTAILLTLLVFPLPAAAVGVDEAIWGIFIAIGGLFTWVGAIVLDLAISELVIGMGNYLTGGIGFAVNQLWTVVRDICNIVFIFALIYIGIRTILRADDSSAQKQLGYLIIAALLINFSLLITKTIVDISNVAAFQIHEQVDIKGDGFKFIGFTVASKGIAGAFMTELRLNTFDENSFMSEVSKGSGITGTIKVFAFSFLMMIFMIIAGVVFLAGGLILIKRFIVLIFFMIFSPLMFAGWIFPAFEKLQSYWWNSFLRNAFIAPAYLFMLYLSLFVIQQLGSSGSFAAAYTPKTGESGGAMIFVFFFVMTGFLIGSLMVAGKMGSATATATLKGLESAGKAVRGNVQSYAGRNSIGWLSRGLAEAYDKGQSRLPSNKLTKAGRGLLNVATLGATSDRTIRNTLKAGSEAKFGGSQSRESIVKEEEAREAKLATVTATRKLGTAIKQGTASGVGADSDERIELQRAVAGATSTQIEELGTKKLSDPVIAGALSTSQFEAVMKSDKFNDAEKEAIAGARSTAIKTNLQENPQDPTSRIKVEDASVSQLDVLGGKFLADPAQAVRLSNKQVEELEKKFTEAEVGRIKSARKTAFMSLAQGNTVKSGSDTLDISFLLKKKPGELASLHSDILTQPQLAYQLPTTVLAKIVQDGTLNESAQRQIRRLLQNDVTPPGVTQATAERLDDLINFFDSSPLGKQFGK